MTAERAGGRFPATLKAGGKLWVLKWCNFSHFYECLNPEPKWKMHQVSLIGENTVRPYWAASKEGIDVARELAAKIGRNRVTTKW